MTISKFTNEDLNVITGNYTEMSDKIGEIIDCGNLIRGVFRSRGIGHSRALKRHNVYMEVHLNDFLRQFEKAQCEFIALMDDNIAQEPTA